jgi:glutathione synthase/RimK-type ligase-like ATP-grasp enzyme
VGEQELDSSDVTAILYRHLHLHEAPHVADPQARELARSELRATLEGALLAIDCYWLNHPYANRLARNKPLQLALAARLGLAVPETQITDDPQEIRDLHEHWGGAMVAKLVGGQVVMPGSEEPYVVFTTPVSAEDLSSEEALGACPAIYQRRVEKAFDLRVTVIGERLYACRIDAEQEQGAALDWRLGGLQAAAISSVQLEDGVASRCLALMRALNLDLAGLDFIVTPEGETVFLEVNAAGQWLWVQQATGMDIAGAIAERLIAAPRV